MLFIYNINFKFDIIYDIKPQKGCQVKPHLFGDYAPPDWFVLLAITFSPSGDQTGLTFGICYDTMILSDAGGACIWWASVLAPWIEKSTKSITQAKVKV